MSKNGRYPEDISEELRKDTPRLYLGARSRRVLEGFMSVGFRALFFNAHLDK